MTENPTTPWTMLATRVLAPNPGPMSLDGTNTYVVRSPDSYQVVIVDPGPLHAVHLQRVMAHGLVQLILLTHHHQDHSASAARLSALTAAPVRAFDATLCIEAPPLVDGEELVAGGTRMRVIGTPGHTADSLCLHLQDDRDMTTHANRGSMLTGDTILGRGTSVIAQPDGSMREYLASLRSLCAFDSTMVLPGHGPMLDHLADVSRAYIEHRNRRIEEVASAIDTLTATGALVTVPSITDLVYPDVMPAVRFAAEMSVKAQMDFIAAESAERIYTWSHLPGAAGET